MATTLAPTAPSAGTRTAPQPLLPPLAPARPAPGLTVLLGTRETLPLAGYLLRHGPALTLVETEPDAVAVGAAMGGFALPLYDVDDLDRRRAALAERALEATEAAGFDTHAVETLPPGDVPGRLRRVAGGTTACVVTTTRSARRARRLARAARAPVLVLPPRDGAPAGGPAVLAAADAARLVPAAARALATEHVVLVGPGTDAAAGALPGEHGLVAEAVAGAGPRDVLAAAQEREGLVVLADSGGFRAPALLRAALAARRPVLLVPATA
jgi:hypothetical protein